MPKAGTLVLAATLLFSAVVYAQAPVIERAYPNDAYHSAQSWDGETYQYPSGKPQISMQLITLKAGQRIPWHCHPVPSAAYVLKGALKIKKPNGQRIVIHAGQPVFEVQNTVHRGIALNGPTELMIFHAGAQGINDTVITSYASNTC